MTDNGWNAADFIPQVRALISEFKRNANSNPAKFEFGQVQLGSYRHMCTKSGGRKQQTGIDLKETYWISDEGDVALIFREGKCKVCGAVARQSSPLIVDPETRPPLQGRVSRT